jgi:hypothetical protein
MDFQGGESWEKSIISRLCYLLAFIFPTRDIESIFNKHFMGCKGNQLWQNR